MSTQSYTVRAVVPILHDGILYGPGELMTVEKTEADLAFALAQGLYEPVEDAAPVAEVQPTKKKAKAAKAEAQDSPAETAEPSAEV